MSRALTIARTVVRTALRGLIASAGTTVVAVATIGVTLVLVGAFALLVTNMQDLLSDFGDALQVQAFLEPGLSLDERRALAVQVQSAPGVASVRIVSEDEALARFRRGVGRGAALLDGLSENPLPASLEIALRPEARSGEGMRVLAGAIDGLPGIDDVSSGGGWVEGYVRAVALVRGVGVGLALILALAAVLIVANTIRLAVVSRRDELEILSLVGASRAFMQTPFLFEGTLQGALGGALALAPLYALFRLVLPGFEFGLELVLGGVSPRFFTPAEAGLVLAAGAGLGLFGSAVALLGERRA